MCIEQRAGTEAMGVNALVEAQVIRASTTTQCTTALSTTASTCLVLKESRAELGLNVQRQEASHSPCRVALSSAGLAGKKETWRLSLISKRFGYPFGGEDKLGVCQQLFLVFALLSFEPSPPRPTMNAQLQASEPGRK